MLDFQDAVELEGLLGNTGVESGIMRWVAFTTRIRLPVGPFAITNELNLGCGFSGHFFQVAGIGSGSFTRR